MRRFRHSASLGLAAVLSLASAAPAQDLTVNGLADLRLVRPSRQASWMQGGLGKVRFGDAGDQSLDLHIGQILADARLKLGPDALVFASLRSTPEQKTAVDLTEAYARYQPIATTSWLWSVKAGAFFPPISLENEGIGWTSPWSITPSAINSWVGDELRTFGGESTLEWRYASGTLGLTGAVFANNDPAGALLADRGWTFGDRPSGLFDPVRVPDEIARERGRRTPAWMKEFLEIDNTPGWYGGVSWRENERGRVTMLHYDNRANPSVRRYGQFAWRTEFDSLGVETYLGDFVLLGQGMVGETEINPSAAARSITHFQSAYVLAGRYFGDWNAAARLDVFATQEHPGPNRDYTEHGHALMLSVGWGPVRWFRLMAEALRVDSSRVQREEIGLPHRAVELQLQLNARLIY